MVNIIDYLPQVLDNALFDGSNLELAKLLLCVLIVFMSALPLLYFDVSINQLMAFELLIVILLTALQWMNIGITLLMVIVIALALSKQVSNIFLGSD